MNDAALLRLVDVGRRFGGVEALKDVNFEIGRSELVGLIGPNGSGKSTLVNVVSGTIGLTRGSIFFDGTEVTRKRTPQIVELGLTRTFQAPRLFWDLTIQRNIEIAELQFTGRSEQMYGFIDTHLPDLHSRGEMLARSLTLFEQKQLEIALRLASRPQLLMLDEPAAGLSPAEEDELVNILQQLNRDYCAVLIIEHSMSVIFRTARRVLVLRGGQLIANGSPRSVAQDDAVIEAYLGPGAKDLIT